MSITQCSAGAEDGTPDSAQPKDLRETTVWKSYAVLDSDTMKDYKQIACSIPSCQETFCLMKNEQALFRFCLQEEKKKDQSTDLVSF